MELVTVNYGNACRVVTTVFHPFEAFYQHRHNWFLSKVTHDSTHVIYSFNFDCRLFLAQPSLFSWGLRAIAKASSGTSRVTVEPAAT